MNEVQTAILITLGVSLAAIIAYLWGVATTEVRNEAKLKQLDKKQRSVSPALRHYYESR